MLVLLKDRFKTCSVGSTAVKLLGVVTGVLNDMVAITYPTWTMNHINVDVTHVKKHIQYVKLKHIINTSNYDQQ